MNSLAGILRQNEIDETRKSQARARAMNNPGGHAKDAEKGRTCKRVSLRDRISATPRGACPALDRLR